MSDDTALLIASACDALLAKYGINMSGESRHELARRKKIFLTSRVAGAQTSLFRQGHVNKAMRLFIKHPSLFGYRAAGMRKRIETALHIAS
jgi:hypothetical protein